MVSGEKEYMKTYKLSNKSLKKVRQFAIHYLNELIYSCHRTIVSLPYSIQIKLSKMLNMVIRTLYSSLDVASEGELINYTLDYIDYVNTKSKNDLVTSFKFFLLTSPNMLLSFVDEEVNKKQNIKKEAMMLQNMNERKNSWK